MPRRLFTLIVILSCCFVSSCGVTRNATLPQINYNASFHRTYPTLDKSERDSLMAIYGENKIFVDEFLDPTLIALSHYPELKESPIEFKYSKESTTMAARPKPLSMFWRRRYVVLINDDDTFEGIKLKDVPYNAQIGIIGHELAHIADYQNHNKIGVASILFRYSSTSRKPLYEKEIDRATIERGLGWQLYDWAQFSMDSANGSTPEYIAFKKEHYLLPEQIVQLVNFFARYGRELE